MSFPFRSVVLVALAASALAGCAAPYGYADGYGTGYGSYGSTGYGSGYGTSGTQISGGYPAYPQSQAYPQQQQTYPQQQAYPQASYPQQPGYDQYAYPSQPSVSQPQASYDNAYGNGNGNNDPYAVRYGWVESIEQLAGQPAGTSGAGAVIGGVVGGLLGHQVGGGRGNTVATIGGAVAGALAGNEVEKRSSTTPPAFRVRVRTNDNAYLTLTQTSPYNLRTGDRVKIQNGVAMPY